MAMCVSVLCDSRFLPDIMLLYRYDHHISQVMDQAGNVANPTRGQLNRES